MNGYELSNNRDLHREGSALAHADPLLAASEERIRDLTRKFNEETDRLKSTLRRVEFEQEGPAS